MNEVPDTAHITLSAPAEKVRRGHELKLVILGEGHAIATAASRDEALIELLAKAMGMRAVVLAAPDQPSPPQQLGLANAASDHAPAADLLACTRDRESHR
jgi:hypothetical protein